MPRNSVLFISIAVILGLTGLTTAFAQPTPTIPMQADRILAEVETFQQLHFLRLSAEQATTLAISMKPLADMLARRQAAENAPEVIAILLEFRSAALAGKPITEQMWGRLSQAKIAAGGRVATSTDEGMMESSEEDPLISLAQRIAADFAGKLTSAQLSILVSSETADWASDILDQAQDKVTTEQDEWDAWIDATLEEIMMTTDELAPGIQEKLNQFFMRLRSSKPGDILKNRAVLLAELTQLMTPPLTEAERRQLAAERLSEMLLNNNNLYSCLLEYTAVK